MDASVQEPFVQEPSPIRQPEMAAPAMAPTADAAWAPLYRIGAVAALASVALIVAAVAVFLLWPPPTTVSGFFALLQRNPFLGLLDLDLLMVMTYAIMSPIYLALYIALRRASQSLMLIALTFELLGVALILGANPAFAMLSLSGQYAAATAEAPRAALLAAGQALMATSMGTGFNVGYVFGALATLLIAAVMLRSGVFSKATAYVGLMMGALTLIPATVGTLGVVLSLLSLAPTVAWLILVALRLFKMSRAPGVVNRMVNPVGEAAA